MASQGNDRPSYRRVVEDSYFRGILSFAAGLVTGAALAIGLDAIRFVPMAIAFGLLCFGFGIVLMEFVALWRKREEYVKKMFEDADFWLKKREELDREKSEWEEEKNAADQE